MRKYDIAYNPPLPNNGEIPKEIDEMSIDELEKRITDVCGKCGGDCTVCETCMGCLEGRTLVNLINDVQAVDPMRGVRAMYGLSPAKKQEIAKRIYMDALTSGNPVEYIMKHCNLDRKNAQHRLSAYRKKYGHIMEFEEKMQNEPKDNIVKVPEKKIENEVMDSLIIKLEKERVSLMKQVDEMNRRIDKIDSAISIIRETMSKEAV